MKTVALLILTVFLFGCKKTVEEKAEDAIMKAMTEGQWVITSFESNGSDLTADFLSYRFQYLTDYTVHAIKSGNIENTGTWQGDVNAMNISANFQNAANPILLLNGTWHITDNSWTYVVATMTVGSDVRSLRLNKQ
jgi:hypothetical protein